MIWLLTFGLCAAICAYVATPFYFKTLPTGESEGPQGSVIGAYREELKLIEKAISESEGNANALETQKSVLEKRLIESAVHTPKLTSKTKPLWAVGTLVVLMMGTFGVYAKIGSPNLTDPRALTSAASTAQQPPAMSPTAFIAEMERDLQTGEESVRKWGLYARALMSVGRYEDAFGAYEKALGLSNNDADIAAELESARSYAAQQSGLEKAQPGPSREDMEAAAKMSAADRAAMIQSMVDGLADKLAQNPDDTEGWVRLLRSRKVLGQTAQAQKDITAMKTHFESTPDIISQILRQSGWE